MSLNTAKTSPKSATGSGPRDNPEMSSDTIFVPNSGSSSLKFGLFAAAEDSDVRAIATGNAEGVGSNQGKISVKTAENKVLYDQPHAIDTQSHALQQISEQLSKNNLPAPAAIGHRVVHGGPNLTEHQKITPKVLAELIRRPFCSTARTC